MERLPQVDLQFEGAGGTSSTQKPHHEVRLCPACSCRNGADVTQPSLQDGYAVVTTHRLLWIDAAAAPSAGASCSLPLAAVQHVQLKGRMLAKMPLGTPKIHITVRTDTQRRVQKGTVSSF